MQQRPVFVVAVIGLMVVVVVVVVAVYLVGSGAQVRQAIGERTHGTGSATTHGPAPDAAKGGYRSVGERIYMTGVGADNKRIAFTDGPPWLSMHGGACVNCHGPDGRGGIPVMPTGMVAPDIRYKVLTGGEHPAAEEEGEHIAFTDDTIKRAITTGLDEEGKPLDQTMPRWQMSEKQLDALLDYLKQLDGDGGK